LRPRATSS